MKIEQGQQIETQVLCTDKSKIMYKKEGNALKEIIKTYGGIFAEHKFDVGAIDNYEACKTV